MTLVHVACSPIPYYFAQLDSSLLLSLEIDVGKVVLFVVQKCQHTVDNLQYGHGREVCRQKLQEHTTTWAKTSLKKSIDFL